MPLTADQEKAGTRQLRQWLENDKRLVTFRDLSRAVGCHVDLAKNLLLSFSSSSPALHKTYLLTGPLLSSSTLARTQLTAERLKAQEDEKSLAKLSATQKIRVVELDEVSDGERNSEDGDMDDVGMDVDQDAILSNDRGAEDGISGFGDKHAQAEADALVRPEQTSRWGVVMAGEEYLEAKKGLFEAEKLSIHICALAPAPVRDPAQYLKHIPDLRAHKRYREPATYGTISGDLASSAAGSSGKGLKDGAMSFASSSKASTTKKAEPATKKEPESSRTPKAAQAQSTLGKATKKDPSPAPPSKPAKSAPAATSAAAGPSQRKSSARAKRQIQSDDEEEAETVKTDTVEPDEEVEKGKNLTSSMVRAEEDQAAMEAMMGMDMDMDMGLDDEEEETQTDTKKAAAPAKVPAKGKSTGGVRKKRKVERQVQETNAKGYTVTKTIVEEVSCSEGEEDEPVATLGKSAAKGRKSNIGQSGTSSRASSVTDTEDRKPSIGASSTSLGPKGSSSSAGGAGAGGKGKALPKPAAKPATGKSKGQSTLAGFFTKK